MSEGITRFAGASARQVDPKTDLYRYGTEILGDKAGGIVTKLLAQIGKDEVFMVKRILQLAQKHPNPKGYIFKVIRNHKDLMKREQLDRQQINNYRPIRGRYPEIDFSHPRQPYYILSNIDGKKLYLNSRTVEELVNQQRDDLGMA